MSELRLPGILIKCDDGSLQLDFNTLSFLNSIFVIIVHPLECRKRPEKVNTKGKSCFDNREISSSAGPVLAGMTSPEQC